jgi:hypothetical protein
VSLVCFFRSKPRIFRIFFVCLKNLTYSCQNV